MLILIGRCSRASPDYVTSLLFIALHQNPILAVVNSPSKMVQLISGKKTPTAVDTVELPTDGLFGVRVFRRFSILVETLVPSQICGSSCAADTKRAFPIVLHPHRDGKTRSVNLTLEQMLRSYIQFDWLSNPPIIS